MEIFISYEAYENILVCNISHKTSTGSKPLFIRFDEIDGFIRVHGVKFRHLLLFDHVFDKTCDKIKYLTSERSGITDSINHNFGEIN